MWVGCPPPQQDGCIQSLPLLSEGSNVTILRVGACTLGWGYTLLRTTYQCSNAFFRYVSCPRDGIKINISKTRLKRVHGVVENLSVSLTIYSNKSRLLMYLLFWKLNYVCRPFSISCPLPLSRTPPQNSVRVPSILLQRNHILGVGVLHPLLLLNRVHIYLAYANPFIEV